MIVFFGVVVYVGFVDVCCGDVDEYFIGGWVGGWDVLDVEVFDFGEDEFVYGCVFFVWC